MSHRFRSMLVVGVLAIVAACSGSSSGSASPDPALAFCPALQAYGKSLAALEALTPTASVADYKAAVDTAKSALAALKLVAGPYAGAQIDSLGLAQQQLEAAAAALPPGTTPAQAEAALQPQLEAVNQQVVLTNNAICNTRPTASPA